MLLVTFGEDDLADLRGRAMSLLDPQHDSLYFLGQCATCWESLNCVGQASPPVRELYWVGTMTGHGLHRGAGVRSDVVGLSPRSRRGVQALDQRKWPCRVSARDFEPASVTKDVQLACIGAGQSPAGRGRVPIDVSRSSE